MPDGTTEFIGDVMLHWVRFTSCYFLKNVSAAESYMISYAMQALASAPVCCRHSTVAAAGAVCHVLLHRSVVDSRRGWSSTPPTVQVSSRARTCWTARSRTRRSRTSWSAAATRRSVESSTCGASSVTLPLHSFMRHSEVSIEVFVMFMKYMYMYTPYVHVLR